MTSDYQLVNPLLRLRSRSYYNSSDTEPGYAEFFFSFFASNTCLRARCVYKRQIGSPAHAIGAVSVTASVHEQVVAAVEQGSMEWYGGVTDIGQDDGSLLRLGSTVIVRQVDRRRHHLLRQQSCKKIVIINQKIVIDRRTARPILLGHLFEMT